MSYVNFNSRQNALDNNGIGSSNIKFTNTTSITESSSSTNNTIAVKVPFPPSITLAEIVKKRKGIKRSAKPSNGFIIYRGEYLKATKRQNIKIEMTQLSKRAGAAWKEEPPHIRKWYKDLAEEVAESIAKSHVQSSDFVENPWTEYTINRCQKTDVVVLSQNDYRNYESNPQVSTQNDNAQNTHINITNSYAPLSKQDSNPTIDSLLECQNNDFYQFYSNVSATTTPITGYLNYIDQSQFQPPFPVDYLLEATQENNDFLLLSDQMPQNFEINFDPSLYSFPETNILFYEDYDNLYANANISEERKI
ncbi:2598_t:CDS:1 [Ambispora leptoticha]|uniref:2598_t:CDS:1 n=1 Tax=Ambispora leptoticha TaxID=144679 RepID=A0A9N8YZ91_9GLOM|nr:2598_t:CDS:1 [Ambispora leptoticha]